MLPPDKIVEHAHEMRMTLHQILEEDLGCFGIVSLANCHDIIVHLHRDIDRLYALHQRLVHPTKHVAYAAFWIRKIKPVASAYKFSDLERAEGEGRTVDEGLEIADVNERISLYYIWRLIETYVAEGQIPLPNEVRDSDKFIKNLSRAFQDFITDRSTGPALNNRFQAVLYDMRYRTFGPHHLVHIGHYLLREAAAYGKL